MVHWFSTGAGAPPVTWWAIELAVLMMGGRLADLSIATAHLVICQSAHLRLMFCRRMKNHPTGHAQARKLRGPLQPFGRLSKQLQLKRGLQISTLRFSICLKDLLRLKDITTHLEIFIKVLYKKATLLQYNRFKCWMNLVMSWAEPPPFWWAA